MKPQDPESNPLATNVAVFLALIVAALTILLAFAAVNFGPKPNNQTETLGVWFGAISVVLGIIVSAVLPVLLGLQQERARVSAAVSSEFQTRIGKAYEDLIVAASKIGQRVHLAISEGAGHSSHLEAARDNTQQVNLVIRQLGDLCGRDSGKDIESIAANEGVISAFGRQLVEDSRQISASLADVGARLELAERTSEPMTREEANALFADLKQEIGNALALTEHITSETIDDETEDDADTVPIRREEHVGCPFCGTVNSFEIGLHPGASALPTCSSCDQRFHAHRGTQGIFARKPGPTPGRPIHCSFSCANRNCTQLIQLVLPEGDTNARVRFCFTCGAKSELSPENRTSKLLASNPIGKGVLLGNEIICERHGAPASEVARTDRAYGVCVQCDALVAANI